MAQEAPETAPRRLQDGSRWPPRRPRWPPRRLLDGQDVLQDGQDGPTMPPRWPQRPPGGLRLPKRPARGLEDGPRALQDVLRKAPK
eukprot:9484303-Pyramimonas_sp.AAC.1